MWNDIKIEGTQRALLIKDGKVVRILTPGKHRFYGFGTPDLVYADVQKARFQSSWIDVLAKQNPELLDEHMVVVQPSSHEVALVSLNGRLFDIVPAGQTTAYWKALYDVTFEMMDVSEAPSVDKITYNEITRIAPAALAKATIQPGHAGLLYVDGALKEILKPGRYGFWQAVRLVEVKSIDLREQALEVTAQEILTKDRVSIRVTLTAFWKIIDPEKAAETKDLNDHLYRVIQFAIRDSVAKRSLDELLNARGDLDAELTQSVIDKIEVADYGLKVDRVGLKDIILPGEMREILNRVVEAEKQAQANLIRRQEETAATRSLLNTARLMENNPLLLRMKELETLEKLTEKIGRIDFSTGSSGKGLNALLDNLVHLSNDKQDND